MKKFDLVHFICLIYDENIKNIGHRFCCLVSQLEQPRDEELSEIFEDWNRAERRIAVVTVNIVYYWNLLKVENDKIILCKSWN